MCLASTSYFSVVPSFTAHALSYADLTPLVLIRVIVIILTLVGVEQAEFLPSIARFVIDILATVPITFYIGMAIAR